MRMVLFINVQENKKVVVTAFCVTQKSESIKQLVSYLLHVSMKNPDIES